MTTWLPIRAASVDRKCDGCGGIFPAARRDARFCSEACKKRAKRARSGNSPGSSETAVSVPFSEMGTDTRVAQNGTANAQVAGSPRPLSDHQKRLAAIPAHVTGADRERWDLICLTEGSAGWPGDCSVPRCKAARAKGALCMQHVISAGGWRGLDG